MGVSQLKRKNHLWSEIIKELGMFLVLAVSIVLFWTSNLLLFIVLLLECLVVLTFWHDRYDRSFFLVVAVLGTISEVLFVHFSIWRYSNPTFFGVPFWFPIAFGTTALIGERLVRTIIELQCETPRLELSA